MGTMQEVMVSRAVKGAGVVGTGRARSRRLSTGGARARLIATREGLRSLPEDAGAARRHVLECLVGLVEADLAVTFSLFRRDEQWVRGSMITVGEDERARGVWREARQSPVCGVFDPEHPRAEEVNRFTGLTRHQRRSAWFSRCFEPLGFGHQLRLLCYDGSRFLGWIGLIRRADVPFRTTEQARLEAIAPALRAAMRSIAEAEDAALAEATPAHLVVSATGSIVCASESIHRWLSPVRCAAIASTVDHLDKSSPSVVTHIDGAELRFHCLVGETLSYVVDVRRAQPATRPAHWRLTERQREIAELAAAGATAPEIARSLEIGVHTVRQHLKTIYRTLEVASRSELALTVAQSPSVYGG